MERRVSLELVEAVAKKHEVDFELMASIIWQESKGELAAYRFELAFFTKRLVWRTRKQLSGYVPKHGVSRLSECAQRASSYGPCQILGETARSILGHQGKWLCSPYGGLFDEQVNIELGCKLMKKLLRRHNHSPFPALKAYNGSSKYPPLILAHKKSQVWKNIEKV